MCVVLGMEPKASLVADKCSVSELWVQSSFYFSRQGLTKLPYRQALHLGSYASAFWVAGGLQ